MNYVGIGFLAVLMIVVSIHGMNFRRKLRTDPVLASGIIVNTKTGKGRVFLKYKFRYQGKEFYNLKGTSGEIIDKLSRPFFTKNFPVLIAKDDYEVNDLLVLKSEMGIAVVGSSSGVH